MTGSFLLSTDLSPWAVVLAAVVFGIGLVLVGWELYRLRRRAIGVAFTGIIAAISLLLAVLRPCHVTSTSVDVGPKVGVLVDSSSSMQLPGDGASRRRVAGSAVRNLLHAHPNVRFSLMGFGSDLDFGWESEQEEPAANQFRSDLLQALHALGERVDEKPSALVVISDGRLDSPSETASFQQLRDSVGLLGVPVHTVSVASRMIADASIREVQAAGAAVAHRPIELKVVVGCTGDIECGNVPVVVRELAESSAPLHLAGGVVKVVEGQGSVEFPITLDRAGPRVVEVAIQAPPGDTLQANNRRYLTFNVARDRVRILHVAGRPTYDVRAMRQWLKSDGSLDVVAFFILRSPESDLNADADEMALIRFPVEELFTEHLPSFDAVVLQDFDALSHGLHPFLSEMQKYVKEGGGLVMVGGAESFSAGNYASTALQAVLPVALPGSAGKVIDHTPFEPQYTPSGRDTPILEALRALYGERLPQMAGANLLGAPRDGAVVLWEHPHLKTSDGQKMPVLALSEQNNGRVVALGVDGAHRLAFSEMAAEVAGRGYGALWDALLGWLMRDPRYEPARIELKGPCRAGIPTPIEVHMTPGTQGVPQLRYVALGPGMPPTSVAIPPKIEGSSFVATLPALEEGGYALRMKVGEAPSMRHDFACEVGGQEWADTRPDPERLKKVAHATKGQFVTADKVEHLVFPPATAVLSERHVTPIFPPWVWTLAAAMALGVHWITRRWVGLA